MFHFPAFIQNLCRFTPKNYDISSRTDRAYFRLFLCSANKAHFVAYLLLPYPALQIESLYLVKLNALVSLHVGLFSRLAC